MTTDRSPGFRLTFSLANRQFGLILLIGLALGVANYALGIYASAGRSIFLQIVISILIGYPTLVVVESLAHDEVELPLRTWMTAGFLYFGIGVVATEGQLLAEYLFFSRPGYTVGQGGGIYLFNGILSVILGLTTLRWFQGGRNPSPQVTAEETPPTTNAPTPLTKVPVKRADKTLLVPVDEVLYFEAYDNYALLYRTDGTKQVCNYSLGQLEQRLADHFLRVHRKYIVNTAAITSVAPTQKGRYEITLGEEHPRTVRSSAGYTAVVRGVINP